MLKRIYRSSAGEGGGGTVEGGATVDGGNNGADSASSQNPNPPAGGASENTSDESLIIKDPAAYWKAQAEKFERLHQKTSDHALTLEERLKLAGDDAQKSAKTEFEKLQAELEKDRAEIAKTRRELDQKTAASEAGLPASLAARLAGATYEEMLADAKALAEIIPAGSGGATSAGRDGAPAASGTLTMEIIRNMSTAEIRARQAEVDAVLAAQRK